MTTFSLNPTYYQVTWTLDGPTDYSSLTGNQNGGLDPTTSWDINRTITVTGDTPVTGTPFTNGDTILINNYPISVASSDTVDDVIERINLATKFTKVAADQSVAGTYITLFNAPGSEGTPFYIAEGIGTALATTGITEGVYENSPSMIGASFTPVPAGGNITINGVNVVFTSGASDLATASSQLNAMSGYTGVLAAVAGPYLQLISDVGQPWTINSGNAVSNLGFTVGNYGGYPATLTASEAKERANMRWQQVINQLGLTLNTSFLGNIARTGNVANIAPNTVTFTVGYDRPDALVTVATDDEPDAGAILRGADAIKRAVARGLVLNTSGNRKLMDPTIENYGPYSDRPNAARIQKIYADGIDIISNVTTVENNLSVMQIGGV